MSDYDRRSAEVKFINLFDWGYLFKLYFLFFVYGMYSHAHMHEVESDIKRNHPHYWICQILLVWNANLQVTKQIENRILV